MKRVLFICRRFCPNEAWSNRLLAYAKGFAEQGIKVCLLFIITNEKRTPYVIDIPGVQIVDLWKDDGYVARIHRGISYFINKKRIKDYIQDGDICFMTDASGLYVDEIKSACKDVKIVFESTEHPMVLAHNDEKKVEQLIKKLSHIDYLFVISHSLKEYFITMGISNEKVNIINMFVDTSRFNGLQKQDNKKYIAYCGNVSYDKDGVNILIEAFAEFGKIYPEYSLEIYGRGVGDSITQLSQLANKLGILNKVLFTGAIPYTEIPQKLTNASILALSRPSNLQNQNGFPTKLGEYLMSGNPVVVTAVGEIPLYIRDGYNGYLAQPNSVKSFVEKLCQAAESLSSGSEVAIKGREVAITEFSYSVQVKKALDIILKQYKK